MCFIFSTDQLPVSPSKRVRPRAARPKSYLHDESEEEIDGIIDDNDPNSDEFENERIIETNYEQIKGRMDRRSEWRNESEGKHKKYRKERRKETDERRVQHWERLKEKLHRGQMKNRIDRKDRSSCDKMQERNSIEGKLFYGRQNLEMNGKNGFHDNNEDQEDEEAFEYYHAQYKRREITPQAIQIKRHLSLEDDIYLVDEFMKQEEQEMLENERKMEEDTTKNFVKAKNVLADLEALLNEELDTLAPPALKAKITSKPQTPKDKKVKESHNTNKMQKKRSSTHKQVNKVEIQKDYRARDGPKRQISGVTSEDGLTSLVEKVRNNKVNEDMRAIIAAAR